MIVAGKQYQLETHPLRNRVSGPGSGLAACAHSSRSIADPSPRSTLGIADASIAADGDIIARATATFRVLT
jgi:hypothetical protein